MSSNTVIVVGAGIIGLTAALRLLESGHDVVMLAKDLPGDPLTPTYASPCAGAHHLSFTDDDDHRQRKLDKRTFDVMWEQLHTPKPGEEEEGAALLKTTQIEYYNTPGEKHIQFYEEMPDFQVLEPSAQFPHSVQFTTFTMDTGPYLAALVKRFGKLDGVLERTELPSLKAALDHPSLAGRSVHAIVNCTGIGSLHLADVADKSVHPVRGHVIVLNAPWIRSGCTLPGHSSGAHTVSGERTYIIPRKSGQVIIGGTRQVGDWSATPESATGDDIKRRALELLPQLSPSYDVSSSTNPKPEDLDAIIIRDVIGFRPGRKGGLRLERGEDIIFGESEIRVFHSYGHSGAGWQASWGCAEEILQLLESSK